MSALAHDPAPVAADAGTEESFVFIDEDGVECTFDMIEDFGPAYESHLTSIGDDNVLTGVWETNLEQVNALREPHPAAADKLAKVFADRLADLQADVFPGDMA